MDATASRYCVTNFAYGTGPYLRTTELALAFNDELEKRGHPRLGIIVPLVYGERQRRVMLEEFGEHERSHPGEILLDPLAGNLLGSVFYANSTYAQALSTWVEKTAEVEENLHTHFSGNIDLTTLSGEKRRINGKDIVVELNRSPRVLLNVAPAYMTTFGYVAEILERALTIGESVIAVPAELLKKGAALARRIEGAQHMRAVAYPATFSGSSDYTPWYKDEILTPPNSSQYLKLLEKRHTGVLASLPAPGIFVTVTGIPGLERLYAEARGLGLSLYSNLPEEVPGSTRAITDTIIDRNTVLQFARSGWGSVWLSMLSGIPIVVPDYDRADDPEIYFNNAMIEELGIGTIYRGQPLPDIIATGDAVRKNCARITDTIREQWGTLDGNAVSARHFAEDFIQHYA